MTGISIEQLSPEALLKGEAMNALYRALLVKGLLVVPDHVDTGGELTREVEVSLGYGSRRSLQVWCVRLAGEGLFYMRKRTGISYGPISDPRAAADLIGRVLEGGGPR